MGLPDRFARRSTLYNRHAESGRGPALPQGARRGCARSCRPSAPFDLRIGPAPYAPFTLGGLETTVDGEVLDLSGDPIPGLFAAGRTTAGVCSFGYASGLSIGDSTMFGRFAGARRGGVRLTALPIDPRLAGSAAASRVQRERVRRVPRARTQASRSPWDPRRTVPVKMSSRSVDASRVDLGVQLVAEGRRLEVLDQDRRDDPRVLSSFAAAATAAPATA